MEGSKEGERKVGWQERQREEKKEVKMQGTKGRMDGELGEERRGKKMEEPSSLGHFSFCVEPL